MQGDLGEGWFDMGEIPKGVGIVRVATSVACTGSFLFAVCGVLIVFREVRVGLGGAPINAVLARQGQWIAGNVNR